MWIYCVRDTVAYPVDFSTRSLRTLRLWSVLLFEPLGSCEGCQYIKGYLGGVWLVHVSFWVRLAGWIWVKTSVCDMIVLHSERSGVGHMFRPLILRQMTKKHDTTRRGMRFHSLYDGMFYISMDIGPCISPFSPTAHIVGNDSPFVPSSCLNSWIEPSIVLIRNAMG
jgi:hypothetical protein